jgi:lipopolysaccharide assembly outer membrane protein LptD (OstA)
MKIGKIVISKWLVGWLSKMSKTATFCLLFIAWVAMSMQQNPSPKRKGTVIYTEHADSMIHTEEDNPDIHVLRGNVKFRHDSTYLYCDSAYLYQTTNSLEAFSNVRIEQGDTLFIFGDRLFYDGNQSLAEMRDNVRMENNDMTLFTDNFNFDRVKNIGYFFDGGMLVDSINELTSVYGQYSPATKIAHFQRKVTLINPQFVLTSDTLIYNTADKIASIVGPSVIESDSGTIYSSRGWYNTVTEESMLFDRSLVVSKNKSKTMTADSLLYNSFNAFAEAFGNMVLNDTLKKVILMGGYGYYDEIADFAFATDSAQTIKYSQGDSLFLHADSIQMKTIDEENEIKAYYGVRFYNENLQGVCDSLQFNTRDSILYMYKNPILWNAGYQIVGDTIKVLFNDSTIERVNVLNYAFAFEEKGSNYYNQ